MWNTDSPPEPGQSMVWVSLGNGLVVPWTRNAARRFWRRQGIPNSVLAWMPYCDDEPPHVAHTD